MEQVTSFKIYTIEDHTADHSISTFLGLSIGVVTTIFTITLLGIQVAGIHLLEWFTGDFHLHGDPSLLYLGIFLICSTILLVVQFHFQTEETSDI